MCEALEKRSQKDKVAATIDAYREFGQSDEDIIARIMKKFNVTKEYVMALLAPQAVTQ